jgi:hypothetical protein
MRFSRRLTWLLGVFLVVSASSATAKDVICDVRSADPALPTDGCRGPLIQLIKNEPAGGGIDVAFWYMTDDRYRSALVAAFQRNVRVRIIVDPRATQTYPGNGPVLNLLKAAGIPMRMKAPKTTNPADILHWKMMYFADQKTVEFSGANYSPESFVATTPYQRYFDEVIFFTDDPRITNSFATKFEDYWTDTTGNVVDYANITGPQSRMYSQYTKDPAMNFLQPWTPPATEDYEARTGNEIDKERALSGGKIDVTMFRISDRRQPDRMAAAANAGVPVRLLTESANYRDARYIWHSHNVDLMWAARVEVKDHDGPVEQFNGLNHQKSVILYAQKEVIFGSSNWSTASTDRQLEHNIFSKPCTAGQTTWCDGGGPNANAPNWFFNWFVQQFEEKWNNINPTGFIEYRPFVPRPGGTPVNSAPSNGAMNVGTTNVVLKWDGGNWNHKYDIYLGTSPTLTASDRIASDVLCNLPTLSVCQGSPYTGKYETYKVPLTLAAGKTYYWRVVGKTMADSQRSADAGLNLAKPGPVWSFTTAGGVSTPFGGTPLSLPGRIEAENFDIGGSPIAYVDTTPGNRGNVYRTTEDVDIGPTSDTGSAFYVGWTRAGESLNYTVNVPSAGTYTLDVRVANTVPGATFRVEVDGHDMTGSMTVPSTGGYDVWQTVTRSGITLEVGTHSVRLVLQGNASNGGAGNFNWLEFR